VEVVEVLPVEATKYEHAAAEEAGAVPPPGFGTVSSYFCSGYLILLRIQD